MSTPDFPTDEIVRTIPNPSFLSTATSLLPALQTWVRRPVAIIKFVPDKTLFWGVRPVHSYPITSLPDLSWGKEDEFILDFGVHMVGRVSFTLDSAGEHMDAPCRLKVTLGESPMDVVMSMEDADVESTWIGKGWLPLEVVTVDECPEEVVVGGTGGGDGKGRRHAFRFLRVKVVDTSLKYKVVVKDVRCEVVSAIAPETKVGDPAFGEGERGKLLRRIDHVCVSTLRDCMQTVFEDGPRRDRRLWLGDLRLQALANYCTLKDYNLVKRCLYLFAAFPRNDGSIPACVFEMRGGQRVVESTDYIVDYDALFVATLCDYVEASGDRDAGRELWKTAEGGLGRALAHVDETVDMVNEENGKGWKFLDWEQGLEHSAGLHGVLVYCLKKARKLAGMLGLEGEGVTRDYEQEIERLSKGAKRFLSGSEEREDLVFISGPKKQISYASASWLVLADIFPEKTSRKVLRNTLKDGNAVRPLTPYLWHHVCEALASVGMTEESLEIIERYWGGMVKAGADTFWECFDEADAMRSPYGDVRINSFCHAWSCTPTYLLRGVLKGKVGGSDEGNEGDIAMGELDERWVKESLERIGKQ
ncbi:alpha-L-rhamnosidase [Zalerion maritima]|uniref:Alpha-L-rhamnosidase n=1 Tax=Zalerion maritima TaxID=339359 RepID=A0AAD5WMC0_9PEZI|nr:alpha-L-rhamnosidase [Zalerion maritima]